MNKAVLILPYFGKFPNYFQLFLNSCCKNDSIDFIIFTDQEFRDYKYKDNIKFYNMSFKDIQNLSIKKLKIDFPIISPYKLCDFRPSYGVLFKDYIRDYLYWGFCDCDLIFGDLSPIVELFDNDYDKILSNGHLTFVKNCLYMNKLYDTELKYCFKFRDIIKRNEPCFFDEIFFPYIVKQKGYKIYENKKIFADILPQFLKFKLPIDNLKNQTFRYESGKIIRNEDNKEFIYIHLQKRNMNVNIDLLSDNYYINPNNFDYNIINFQSMQFMYRVKYYLNIIKKMNFRKILIKIKTIIFKRMIRK